MEKPGQLAKRDFIKWSIFIYLSLVLLSLDLFKKLFSYISPNENLEKDQGLLLNRINLLEKQTKQEKLKLERLQSSEIFIAKLDDLSTDEALSFIDFNLKPGIAFLNKNSEPILLTAVCTHLGCSVANKISDSKLLCPCHNAYFSAETGEAAEGPSTKALEKINFTVKEGKIFILK